MICRCGRELDAPRTEWVHCPSCGASYDPPLEVLPARMLRNMALMGIIASTALWVVILVSIRSPSLELTLSAGLAAICFSFGFVIAFMVPVVLFRAGMNRRRRSRLR